MNLTHVPHATHHYRCERGHENGAPFALRSCQLATCGSPLTPFGEGSRTYNKPEEASR